jgi:hypothetical protein
MQSADEHASSEATLTGDFAFIFAASTTQQTPFTFGTPPLPDMGLTFLPRPQPRPKKRNRATADIDGEHSCMQKKKRRLRLFLITSRLSPQFSHPATNIVDRGSSKIAVWAKQRSLGRNLLRKAAILNHIRIRAVSVKEMEGRRGRVLVEHEKEHEELAMAKLEFTHGSVDTYTRPVTSRHPSVPPAAAVRSGGRFVVSGSPTGSPTSSRSPSPTPSPSPPNGASENHASDYRSPNGAYENLLPRAQIPRRDYSPLPPSPLGLSNYDAFDADENLSDPYFRFDDEDDVSSTYLFDEDEDDADTVPFSPSAATSASSPAMHTQTLRPPADMYTFSALDHVESVMDEYDQVDERTSAVWSNKPHPNTTTILPTSSSSNPLALSATAHSKRADSFATSPNFRPTIPTSPTYAPPSSTSPNFVPASSHSPAFTPICPSPSFTATAATSPNFSPTSPNLPALDAPPARRHTEGEEERRRQRELMDMRFGS